MLLTIVSFIVVLSILVFVHELGHFLVARWGGVQVEEFGIGYPPRVWTIMKRGGTLYTINAIPFGGFVRLAGEEDPNVSGGMGQKPKRTRVAIMASGSLMNFLLAIVAFTLSLGLTFSVGDGVRVTGVVESSPAASAGVKVGDRIVAVDDQKIASPEEMIAYTSAREKQEIIVRVERASESVEIPVTPRFNAESNKAEIGLMLAARLNWGQAFVRGAQQTADVVLVTLSVPYLVLQGIVPAEAARPIGPVGIAQLAGGAVQQSLATGWWYPILQLIGLLSTALAITNLLPLPALDGGRILFVIIEAIRGRRIAPEKEGTIHLIGFGLLLSLLVIITVADITHPLPAVDWSTMF